MSQVRDVLLKLQLSTSPGGRNAGNYVGFRLHHPERAKRAVIGNVTDGVAGVARYMEPVEDCRGREG